jgi:hypothetical protein
MKSHIVSGLVGGLIVAAFLAAGIASGAVGDPIRAGQKTIYGGGRGVVSSTELEGSPSAPLPLLVLDKNTNGPVLRLEPLAGQPALSLSNNVKITNLNADTLDGLDSMFIPRGRARATAINPGVGEFVLSALPFFQLSYQCPSNLGEPGELVLQNDSTSSQTVFFDRASQGLLVHTVSPGGLLDLSAENIGETFHIQAVVTTGILTIDGASQHRGGNCHVHAQELLHRFP